MLIDPINLHKKNQAFILNNSREIHLEPDGYTDGQTDRQTDGLMDGQMDGQTD